MACSLLSETLGYALALLYMEFAVLVLKRKRGEEIKVGESSDGIRVVVLECSSRGVRLGVEAPDSVRVRRAEDRRQSSKVSSDERIHAQ